ncbi:MAG: hypothetical protein EBX67_11780 [Betaproteobacteria bacterium]|nr:hypothetical protein [Betaproteobacteria bacterium]NDH44530.1 hypothetical protein [Betaproteobacteria bacterium]NDH58808.1 hypothetical protein [Betaproteobacteria bacterium]
MDSQNQLKILKLLRVNEQLRADLNTMLRPGKQQQKLGQYKLEIVQRPGRNLLESFLRASILLILLYLILVN